jgi:hypothetical protein
MKIRNLTVRIFADKKFVETIIEENGDRYEVCYWLAGDDKTCDRTKEMPFQLCNEMGNFKQNDVFNLIDSQLAITQGEIK